MLPTIIKSKLPVSTNNLLVLAEDRQKLPVGLFAENEMEFIRKKGEEKKDNELVILSHLDELKFYYSINSNGTEEDTLLERYRLAGNSLTGHLIKDKAEKLTVYTIDVKTEYVLAFVEGIALGNYQFLKYKSDPAEKESTLRQIFIASNNIDDQQINDLNILCQAVYYCRDMVNEPWSALDATKLAGEFMRLGNEAGARVEILGKKEIEALGMGGLLAVNKGSVDPPTFTVMEWKPTQPMNEKPVILVGKGIVFDTGGLSLKPPSSMDGMKSDMAGAAAAACGVFAVAKMNLPLHVIALLPATDNRPQGNATVPGDVITMLKGTTVEVLNTDAEGRLILADALTYAKRWTPLLVIDLATLTGAASAAIGSIGMVGMQNGAEKYFDVLSRCGFRCHERIVEFPLWEEYGEMIKSEIADLKNIGGKQAGAITAGKFLEKFIDYPWIHLDIAGPAMIETKDGYRTNGGTGVGVRLLIAFMKELKNM